MAFIDKNMNQSERLRTLISAKAAHTVAINVNEKGEVAGLRIMSALGGWMHKVENVSQEDRDYFLQHVSNVSALVDKTPVNAMQNEQQEPVN